MPSFDVISDVDKHELSNAVAQAHRALSSPFHFKGSPASFELPVAVITQQTPAAFHPQPTIYPLRSPLPASPPSARPLPAGGRVRAATRRARPALVAVRSAPPGPRRHR